MDPAPPRSRRRTAFTRVPRPSLYNRAARGVWGLAWNLLCRPTPRPMHRWRCAVLRAFGADIEQGCMVYPTARVWAPWNLTMKSGACLGDWVDCYNVTRVTLGPRSVVSQYSFLCTASHDYTLESHPLIVAPIEVGERAWVCADTFVAPGVTIGSGAVASARSVVLQNLSPWKVHGGHPARELKDRTMRPDPEAD